MFHSLHHQGYIYKYNHTAPLHKTLPDFPFLSTIKANFLTLAYRAAMLPSSQVCTVHNGNGALGSCKVTVLSVESSYVPSAAPSPDTIDTQVGLPSAPDLPSTVQPQHLCICCCFSRNTFHHISLSLICHVFDVCLHLLGSSAMRAGGTLILVSVTAPGTWSQ